MPNPTTPVKGYRVLSDEDIAAVNANKEIEETILQLIDKMSNSSYIDQRWLAIGRTHIEQGFGAINRAIMRPERVVLPGAPRAPPSTEQGK